MQFLDWTLFVGFLVYVIWDGTRRARTIHGSKDYFLAGRAVPWWAMGLSIMATQASAITMIGTTGQGWADGLRFVQFYFALPLAMIILSVTAVPAYHRLGVSTAYEYLGLRFDQKTRLLSAVLFLVLRGLSVGFVIYAPSLILAKVFALPVTYTVLFMGVVAVLYTAIGGLGAVISTDVKQMTVMTAGLVVAFLMALHHVTEYVSIGDAVRLARAGGRLEIVDWTWNPSEKYTMWSSLIGGLFLFLSYFGTDQSQVQRLLSGRSIRHIRGALWMNAIAKVPFQFLVLSLGALLFVFYIFQGTPVTFEPGFDRSRLTAESEDVQRSVRFFEGSRHTLREAAATYVAAPEDPEAESLFKDALTNSHKLRALSQSMQGRSPDTNFVFLDFILNHLPVGIVGLLLAAIFAAALSSIDSELNAMTSVAVLDVYVRGRPIPLDGRRFLWTSRIATLLVGAFATAFALYAGHMGSLIEAVNHVGSYIYGSLLGAFLLAWLVPWANGHGAFVGLLSGMAAVAYAATQTDLAFLYLNTVGTAVVVVVGALLSAVIRVPRNETPR